MLINKLFSAFDCMQMNNKPANGKNLRRLKPWKILN
jgi:hypothetical protein